MIVLLGAGVCRVLVAALGLVVVVSAQLQINAAEAFALNQTLVGLGCYQSTSCIAKKAFVCSGDGTIQCNAANSVTHLYVEPVCRCVL